MKWYNMQVNLSLSQKHNNPHFGSYITQCINYGSKKSNHFISSVKEFAGMKFGDNKNFSDYIIWDDDMNIIAGVKRISQRTGHKTYEAELAGGYGRFIDNETFYNENTGIREKFAYHTVDQQGHHYKAFEHIYDELGNHVKSIFYNYKGKIIKEEKV